ncbi:MAG: acyltransferase [Bacillota bacterium]|nr:acyltransferase [Bacillota bacterium]
MNITEKLLKIEKMVNDGVTSKDVCFILEMIGGSVPVEILEELKLYTDYLPMAKQVSFSDEKRYLHFLWDVLDRLPIGVVANFAIPYRRIIAQKLFKKCGKNFIAEENVRFNIADNIEIGDDVFINRGVFIDSKGGVSLGNSVGLAENVMIITHSHSEDDHSRREYGKVVIEDYAKIYINATIFPGVTIGEQAVVASGAIVNKDVYKDILVGGVPAKPLRERKTMGRTREELSHIWLHDRIFQEV